MTTTESRTDMARWSVRIARRLPLLFRRVKLGDTARQVDARVDGELQRHLDNQNARMVRHLGLVIGFAAIFVLSSIVGLKVPSEFISNLSVIFILLSAFGMLWNYLRLILLAQDRDLAEALVSINNILDSNSSFTPELQRTLNWSLDRIARLTLAYPRKIGDRTPEVGAVAAKKARGIMELHQWVSTPLYPDTFYQLRLHMRSNLNGFLDLGLNGLHDPSTDGTVQRGRLKSTIAGLALIAVAVAAVVFLTVKPEVLGAATSVVIVPLFGLAALGITLTGVSESALGRYSTALDSLKKLN